VRPRRPAGAKVADYIAEHRAGKRIAILDDGTTWGAGVADGARRRLKERGVVVALDETITPGLRATAATPSR
jgi:branched-chain amino acid transport system substrate-binding protein